MKIAQVDSIARRSCMCQYTKIRISFSSRLLQLNMSEDALCKDMPLFKDVVPIPQDDGPNPVCSIAYSEEFTDAMDYFRALSRSNEHSERALQLTEKVIGMNPANYSVWHYRRQIIFGLGSNLNEERDFVTNAIEENPKNYQVWYHRRAIVEKLGDPSEELGLTKRILMGDEDSKGDAKNYHSWSHRHWVIRTFKLFEGGLDFVEALLASDVRNNSAWNHRYFLIENTEEGWSDEVVVSEVRYALEKLKKAFHNESGWNYLRGVTGNHAKGLLVLPDIVAVCNEAPSSVYAAAVLADALIAGGSNVEAGELFENLATEIDPIREKYWKYRRLSLEKR